MQQPKDQPKSAGTVCDFRALLEAIMRSGRPRYKKGQADVASELLRRPHQPRGGANNIRHTPCAPNGWEGALTVQPGTTFRLRVTLAR